MACVAPVTFAGSARLRRFASPIGGRVSNRETNPRRFAKELPSRIAEQLKERIKIGHASIQFETGRCLAWTRARFFPCC